MATPVSINPTLHHHPQIGLLARRSPVWSSRRPSSRIGRRGNQYVGSRLEAPTNVTQCMGRTQRHLIWYIHLNSISKIHANFLQSSGTPSPLSQRRATPNQVDTAQRAAPGSQRVPGNQPVPGNLVPAISRRPAPLTVTFIILARLRDSETFEYSYVPSAPEEITVQLPPIEWEAFSSINTFLWRQFHRWDSRLLPSMFQGQPYASHDYLLGQVWPGGSRRSPERRIRTVASPNELLRGPMTFLEWIESLLQTRWSLSDQSVPSHLAAIIPLDTPELPSEAVEPDMTGEAIGIEATEQGEADNNEASDSGYQENTP